MLGIVHIGREVGVEIEHILHSLSQEMVSVKAGVQVIMLDYTYRVKASIRCGNSLKEMLGVHYYNNKYIKYVIDDNKTRSNFSK